MSSGEIRGVCDSRRGEQAAATAAAAATGRLHSCRQLSSAANHSVVPAAPRFDDEVNKESTDLVLKISEQRRNPNGCKVPVTW